MKNKLVERFKSFRWNHWVFFSLLLLFIIAMLWFLIGMSVSLSKGLSLFGGSYGEETSQTPGNMDYIILAFAVVLNVLLIAIFIYHMFFSKIEPIGPQDKVIIKGRIVETKMEQDLDQDESDKSN